MLPEQLIYLGIIINSLGGLSYFWLTLKGKVQPNKVTWGLWGTIPLIAFAAELSEKVGIQSLLTLGISLIPLLIFFASFVNKKAYWKISKLDLVCGGLAILGVVLWLITKSGNTAILFSLVADILAGFPTVIKAFKQPETENYLAFTGGSIFGAITLLTIKNWNFATYAFPAEVFILNGLVAFFIFSRVGKRT